MTQCCPLGEADEYCTVWHERTRKAAKPHTCEECRETINIGDKYSYTTSLFDGSWSTTKMCLSCKEIGDHFACGGRVIGMLWEELEEYFFPDMKAGGPCLDGLSPSNKQRLFDRRTVWLFERGEQ